MNSFVRFLLVAFGTAFVFEVLAHFIDPLNKTFDNIVVGIPFFIVWYGVLYTIAYFALRKRPLWLAVIAFAVVGTAAEIFIFRRSNLLIDPLIYAIMGFVPFKFGIVNR